MVIFLLCFLLFTIINMDHDKRFVVIKFINQDDDCNDDDDTFFEVGLSKWLGELDNDMKTEISWPPKSEQAVALKKEIDASSSWPKYNIIVLKFYDTLLSARNGRNGFVMSSTYETDIEFGRGKRKKIERRFSCDSPLIEFVRKRKTNKINQISDDSDSNSDNFELQFTSKKSVAAPPPVPFKSQNSRQIKPQKCSKYMNAKMKISQNKNDKFAINTSVLSSARNKKYRKDLLLEKIDKAKKKISSSKDNRTEIIEAARQRQVNDINKQPKLIPVLSQHDVPQSSRKCTDANSKPEMFSQIVSDDTEKSVCTGSKWQDSAIDYQGMDEEFKENNDSFSMSSDNDISHRKTSAGLVMMQARKKDTSVRDIKSIEKPSSVSNDEFQSELCQINRNATYHVKRSSSTPHSVITSDNTLSTLSEKTCIDVKDLQKKIYILNQEISSKLDTIIMNQCRLNYYLLPNEKRIIRPTDFPSLPLMTEEDI